MIGFSGVHPGVLGALWFCFAFRPVTLERSVSRTLGEVYRKVDTSMNFGQKKKDFLNLRSVTTWERALVSSMYVDKYYCQYLFIIISTKVALQTYVCNNNQPSSQIFAHKYIFDNIQTTQINAYGILGSSTFCLHVSRSGAIEQNSRVSYYKNSCNANVYHKNITHLFSLPYCIQLNIRLRKNHCDKKAIGLVWHTPLDLLQETRLCTASGH